MYDYTYILCLGLHMSADTGISVLRLTTARRKNHLPGIQTMHLSYNTSILWNSRYLPDVTTSLYEHWNLSTQAPSATSDAEWKFSEIFEGEQILNCAKCFPSDMYSLVCLTLRQKCVLYMDKKCNMYLIRLHDYACWSGLALVARLYTTIF
jgi:hypothetical protein